MTYSYNRADLLECCACIQKVLIVLTYSTDEELLSRAEENLSFLKSLMRDILEEDERQRQQKENIHGDHL